MARPAGKKKRDWRAHYPCTKPNWAWRPSGISLNRPSRPNLADSMLGPFPDPEERADIEAGIERRWKRIEERVLLVGSGTQFFR